MEVNKIYNEDCLETMARMPDGLIDLTITSPPYDNLRDYKGYSFEFENIAKELYRITKAGGVVVWVVNDSVVDGSETLTSAKQAIYFKEVCGFNIHDTMIYMSKQKYPDPLRYGGCFEFMYVLSKGRPNTINLIKDRKNRWFESFGVQSERLKNGEQKKRKKIEMDEYGVRFNIWKIDNGYKNSTEDEVAFKHPATFPEQLAHDHIISWSKEGDIIYDPFGGSGTTAKMAHLLRRNWIISEVSEEYCREIIKPRLEPYLITRPML